MKTSVLVLVFLVSVSAFSQVGINTTNPNAQLEIMSSNQATPSNTDGILIPKIDAFPASNPGANQQGMLVYLTTMVSSNAPGFYYWDNATTSWLPIKGTDGGTLDQAYDFGGAGNGKTITADNGAVLINGTDGLVSTGTLNSGALAPGGSGVKMFWNPRKAAFRAGKISFDQWDDVNIGESSVAFGNSSRASGQNSFAAGNNAYALGYSSSAFGSFSNANGSFSFSNGLSVQANGIYSAVFGESSSANGTASYSFGRYTYAIGEYSTTIGLSNTSRSFGEVVIGLGATDYTTSTNGAIQFGTANATDRLFVIGNAIDSDNSGFINIAERSDAMIVLKNGLTRLPSTTNAMIDAADGKTVVTKEYLQTSASGTLDQAYDFGGAGNGKTITADNGAVLIDGTDGFVSSGISGTGAFAPTGAGTRMVWNPRKAAFRVGTISGTQWDDASIGINSVAFGGSTATGNTSFAGSGGIASGTFSFAYGFNATATGQSSIAIGQGASVLSGAQDAIAMGLQSQSLSPRAISIGAANIASGGSSVAIGAANNTTGFGSVAIGLSNISNGNSSTSFGLSNTAPSYGETVLGIGATTYTPSINGDTQFRTANAVDRLFVIGNAIDTNNNTIVDTAERSDAMIVLKNGLTRLPSTTNTMIDAADGKAIVTKEYLQTNSSGTLDQAYDFGGAGAGRTITADTGAVLITGTDGLVATGTLNSGALAPSGAGVKMFWNPRKAAFRAGNISGTQWDDANIGTNSVALGLNSIASGSSSIAFGQSTASGSFSVAGGNQSISSGISSTSFGNLTTASGQNSTALGSQTEANGFNSFSVGNNSIANGSTSIAIGNRNTASGNNSTAFGNRNTASSFGETVIGIGATTYTPSINGGNQFRAANATDRLFVIGNALDANNSDNVDDSERSDAIVVLKNGNTGVGISAPTQRLHVAGKSLFENGFTPDNAALLYKTNTDYMFIGPQSGSSVNGGAIALYGSTSGTFGNAGGIDLNAPNNSIRFFHTNGNFSFRANSTGTYTGSFEINDSGFLIGHNSASRALLFSPNSTERMRLTPGGFLGIGTTAPARKLHVSNGVSGGTSNGNTGILLESSGNVYQHFLTASTSESGMLFGSESASINGGIIFNNSGATNGIQFRTGGNFNRMTITAAGFVGIGTTAPGGLLQLAADDARKPGSSTWIIVSDVRLKNIKGNYTNGLNEILQLNPVRFQYRNNGERKFEEKVLNTEYSGFIAQEVQTLFPEAVGTDEDGYLNLNIHPILIASVNAFKELNTKYEELKIENEELKSKLNTLLTRVDALENQ